MVVNIRWMIRRDMPEVMAIEFASFEWWWSESDFINCLRTRNCIGLVAEYNEKVIGYMVYELHKRRYHVLNFAVHPEYRRKGIGKAMVADIQRKLWSDSNVACVERRRTAILLEVRERNLDAQLFWRQCGFRYVRTLRGFYDDTSEDAYQMAHYSVEPASMELVG